MPAFRGDRRAAFFADVSGATPRDLRVASPSGHLPRAGRALPLDDFPLEGAGFPSESPAAQGVFDLDGPISVPVVTP